ATFLLLFYNAGIAQVKTKIFNNDISLEKVVPKVKTREIVFAEPKDIENIKKQIENSPSEINKFAHSISTDLDLMTMAEKTTVSTNTYYSLTIKAKNALNLSLSFNMFKLSPNAVLSIYNNYELTDSITTRENNKLNIWATRVYQGDKITLLVIVPNNETNETALNISTINYGIKNYGGDFGSPGNSANCNINVACSQGNGWENEQNAVTILLVADGTGSCTGTLVMNTCSTNTPYVLTANHCLEGNLSNWVFQFQYWSTACHSNTGYSEDLQFNGCTLKANNATTDFLLVEMNTIPQPTSGLYYAGWSRSTTGITNTTILHHPKWDLMKIAIDNGSPVQVTDVLYGIARPCWQLDLDDGIVQQGSSGAAYFNQNHQIIGQHFRRPDFGSIPDCSIKTTVGGRFDQSWTGGGTNSTRLSNWLDPDNTGAMTTNTTNISLLPTPGVSLAISGSTSFCTGTPSYTLNNSGVAYTGNVTWVSSAPSIASITSSGNPATLTKNGNGQVTITATIIECGIQYTHNLTIDVGLPEAPEFIEVYGNGADDPLYLCPGGYRAEAFTTKTYPQFEWLLPSTWTSSVSGGNNPFIVGTLGFDIPIHVYSLPSTEYMRVRTINGCGYSTPVFLQVGTDCGGYRMSNYIVSPNPAKEQIKIDGGKHNKTIREVQIIDKTGNIKLTTKYSVGTKFVNLNVSKLYPDIYYIKIYDGYNWESKIIKID
ncbi:MAG: hypothetical protein KDB92_02455, partial [Chitinophagaceae bacterium]|nr:hypothetical protein [Chitinophagaceae bacterium]